jgi:hypothetical protein
MSPLFFGLIFRFEQKPTKALTPVLNLKFKIKNSKLKRGWGVGWHRLAMPGKGWRRVQLTYRINLWLTCDLQRATFNQTAFN